MRLRSKRARRCEARREEEGSPQRHRGHREEKYGDGELRIEDGAAGPCAILDPPSSILAFRFFPLCPLCLCGEPSSLLRVRPRGLRGFAFSSVQGDGNGWCSL